jgi:hypothetical protein
MKPDMNPLSRLVAEVDRARPFTAPPVWVRINGPVTRPASIEQDLGLEGLVGFVAPGACSAVGVVATGWTTDLPGRTGRPNGNRQRVRSTVLVDRKGRVAGRVRWASGRIADEPPSSGRILECLRRALGLATAPPSVSTDILFASMWLAALSDASERSSRPLTWSEAVALHPVGELLADGVTAGAGWLVDAANALAVACPWSEVRRLIAEGAWDEAPVAPGAAAWMDDGMLCRWLLDGQAPLAEQVKAAVVRLSPQLARRVRRTLSELGLASGGDQYR